MALTSLGCGSPRPGCSPCRGTCRSRTGTSETADLRDDAGRSEPAPGPLRARPTSSSGRSRSCPSGSPQREYDVLRELEDRSLPAVRAAGLVHAGRHRQRRCSSPATSSGRGSSGGCSCGCRRTGRAQRARLFDAMASLLVDLHRNGVYWGDCSLANTLFIPRRPAAPGLDGRRRDQRGAPGALATGSGGGPRDHGGERRGRAAGRRHHARPPAGDLRRSSIEEAPGVAARYEALWDVLHEEPLTPSRDRSEIERPDPPAQRPRLRRRRDVAWRRPAAATRSCGSRWPSRPRRFHAAASCSS